MREIKFRAWDKRKNEMICNQNFLYNKDGFLTAGNSGAWNKEDYLFMQFTGLKDKNGKEIYEGDIVCVNHKMVFGDGRETGKYKKNNYTIEWYNNAWSVKGIKDNQQHNANSFSIYIEGDTEIIGNIHENPELLEEINE